jgi:hypothetical protein
MKFLFLLCGFVAWETTHCQKILIDEKKPISGRRQIVTDLLPVFKMKVIQVAAMAEIGPSDSVYTLAFYFRNTFEVITQSAVDTSRKVCQILLADGTKSEGTYVSMTTALNMQILSFRFSSSDFKRISDIDATAYSVAFPNGQGTGEYVLEEKYEKSIRKVCDAVLKKLRGA